MTSEADVQLFIEKPMEFAAAMVLIDQGGDIEGKHEQADALICELLNALGYEQAVLIFEKMEKWYA